MRKRSLSGASALVNAKVDSTEARDESDFVLNDDACGHIKVIAKDVQSPEHVYLSPSTVAKMFELSPKWLSAAREGRKGFDGPPFKKLGNGRSSPVRYNLAETLKWINTFPSQTSSHSFSQFLSSRSHDKKWLFVCVGQDLIQLSTAINRGLLDADKSLKLKWLNYWQWLEISSHNTEMSALFFYAFDRIKEIAIDHRNSISVQTIDTLKPTK
jgi:hypothetical protein